MAIAQSPNKTYPEAQCHLDQLVDTALAYQPPKSGGIADTMEQSPEQKFSDDKNREEEPSVSVVGDIADPN